MSDTCPQEPITAANLLTDNPVLIVPIAVVALSFLLLLKLLALFANPIEAHECFSNGLNVSLLIKVFLGGGASYSSLIKFMGETCRKRLLICWKHFLFFGYDHWLCGHPVIAKQVFSPANAMNWTRADYYETQNFFYSTPAKPEKLAMLYVGSGDRWRQMRHVLSPFFYKTDFAKVDGAMDDVCKKHLQAAISNTDGNIELLDLTLRTTLDLVLRIVYGLEIDDKSFEGLLLCLAKFIVPESSGSFKFDGKTHETFAHVCSFEIMAIYIYIYIDIT